MYSVVTSMNRAPCSASRRASRQPCPNRPVLYFASFSRLQRRSNAFAAGELEQPVRVLERPPQTLALVLAAILADRTRGHQLLVLLIALLETLLADILVRPGAGRGIFRDR